MLAYQNHLTGGGFFAKRTADLFRVLPANSLWNRSMEPDLDSPEFPEVIVTNNGSSRSINATAPPTDPNKELRRMESLRRLSIFKRISWPQLSTFSVFFRSLSLGVKRSQSAVAQFLGVDKVPEENQHERQAMWEARRMTLGKNAWAIVDASCLTIQNERFDCYFFRASIRSKT